MASGSRSASGEGLSSASAALLPDSAQAWFADSALREALHESAAATHAARKILIASPGEEIRRICPDGERVLGAGAVLRLGGSYLGGYSEADVSYAYRQLSRVLHPDKNQNQPQALNAFKRLSDAADELRSGLAEARSALGDFCAALGCELPSSEMLQRPHIALFAEANRVLAAVLFASGEGDVDLSRPAKERAVAAFRSSSSRCTRAGDEFLAQWYDKPDLLERFSGTAMRTAYDSSPKTFRAQFLCMLHRAVLVEAKRTKNQLQAGWSKVLMQFPELPLWQHFKDQLQVRTWGCDQPCDGRAEEHREPTAWAAGWRRKMRAVLPSFSSEEAVANHDEIKSLATSLWNDVAQWARGAGMQNVVELFVVEHPGRSCASNLGGGDSDWAFVPVADLLLVVGEGIVGLTAAGLFVDRPSSDDCEAILQRRRPSSPPRSCGIDPSYKGKRRSRSHSRCRRRARHRSRRSRSRSRSSLSQQAHRRIRSTSRRAPSKRRRSGSPLKSRSRSNSAGGRWPHDRWIGRERSCTQERNLDDDLVPQQAADDNDSAQWSCAACTALNHALLRECEVCETPRARVAPRRSSGFSAGTVCMRQWSCAVCTFKNHPELQECEVCQVGRGAKAFLAHLAATSRSPYGSAFGSSGHPASSVAANERSPAKSRRRR